MRVMPENIQPAAPGSLFFELPPAAPGPRLRRPPLTVDRRRVEGLGVEELTRELVTMLARLTSRTPADLLAGETAPDGTAAIKSIIAVCLIGTVGKAFGKPRLIRLAQVKREDLRSLGGVARLLRAAIDQLQRAAA
jgi:hypothetical protein